MPTRFGDTNPDLATPMIDNTEILKPMGMTVDPSGEITFVTHTGREIIGLPVVQNPSFLQQSLQVLGLNQMTMQSNGNLKIPAPNKNYYMARPNLFSQEVSSMPLGIGAMNSPWLANLTEVFLVFEAYNNSPNPLVSDSSFQFETGDERNVPSSEPKLRQQFMYPAAANPQALYALSEETRDNQTDDCQTSLHNDGRISICIGTGQNKQLYKGILDYLVEPRQRSSTSLTITDLGEDRNRDNLNDYRITYPNGDRQIMYQCTNCVE